MNRVSLVGRITRDPELKTSPNGTSFVQFSLAIDRIMPNSAGEREADFINCVVFGKSAENLARFVKKGRLIGVEGRLQSNRFQGQDGTARTTINVVSDNVYFLESKNSQDGQPSMPNYNNQAVPAQGNRNYGANGSNYNQGYANNQNNYGYNPSMGQPMPQPNNMAPTSNYRNNMPVSPNPVGNQAAPAVSQNQNQKNPFDDVQKQFDITDDDLPF
jgi:single-strand DNA-binding protein